MTPANSIQPADFASPEAIDRNLKRLAQIGDRGATGNLFAAADQQPAASALGRIDSERARVAESAPAAPEPSASQSVLSIFASGDDLPLFSS